MIKELAWEQATLTFYDCFGIDHYLLAPLVDPALLILGGAEVRSDFYKAQQIGELWEQLTAGRGYYYSCNAEKDQYGDEVGIGTIRRDDIQARTKVVKAMHYLTKDTQYLHLKPARAKAFRTGCIRRSTA
ncbi:hypothetical protein GIW50_07420 [Pseudomonas syringae]|uniref:Uncharacterized protein n=1 Tax=Pseudomonas syringae TaxID=317 RepID=A0A9Q3X297_PSESX|nr:hypothetical protein [Pseudomonas syringae]MCF5061653.1 hypothetical protein [Pseudomonas syringae]MCF5073039.1 hypothetical protein [Pseudomonas syringae]MCF5118241.1 hypothetical protein [Pseudomonas syringae]MCF5378363.1 hypothetical protein [Pseudomonas syringae]